MFNKSNFSADAPVPTVPNRIEGSNQFVRSEYQCLQCFKYFSSKHCLKEHYFTHTDERPYQCKSCTKRFKHASQLSLHKKTHKPMADLKWAKLTDLVKIEKKKEFTLEFAEKILLPPISGPQAFTLPMFDTFESK